MKSEKYTPFFNQWLEFMENAYHTLTPRAYSKLEDRIVAEITFAWQRKSQEQPGQESQESQEQKV